MKEKLIIDKLLEDWFLYLILLGNLFKISLFLIGG